MDNFYRENPTGPEAQDILVELNISRKRPKKEEKVPQNI
jgi:hypothetical protein